MGYGMTIEEYTEMSIRESLKVGNAALKACKDRQKAGIEYNPTTQQTEITTKDKGAQALIYVVITVLVILIIATLIAVATNH